MEGKLVIVKEGLRLNKEDGTRQFTISPNSGDYFTNLFAHNGGGLRLRAAPDDGTAGYKTGVSLNWQTHTVGGTEYPMETDINYLKTPTSKHHAANKQYVDDAVANASNIQIPGRRYRYSTSSAASLSNGYFTMDGDGKMYISRYDHDGIEIATTYANDWQSAVKFAVTVRDSTGAIKHAYASDHWYQGKDGNKHIRYNIKTMIKKGSLTNGSEYWIADGIYCI